MKYLNRNQTLEEFNETLKEGIEYGFILQNSDLMFLAELYDNLTYYFTFFCAYGKEKEI